MNPFGWLASRARMWAMAYAIVAGRDGARLPRMRLIHREIDNAAVDLIVENSARIVSLTRFLNQSGSGPSKGATAPPPPSPPPPPPPPPTTRAMALRHLRRMPPGLAEECRIEGLRRGLEKLGGARS